MYTKHYLLLYILIITTVGTFAKGITETTFKVVHTSDPTTLDPHFIDNMNEHRIYSALFEGLFRINAETNEVEPALAESWSVSNDKMVYSIRLKNNIVWTDGTPITAETVRDSWLRIIDPRTEAPYSWLPVMFIKGAKEFNESDEGEEDELREKVKIRVRSLLDLEFETVVPLPHTIRALTHVAFTVVPIHTISEFEGTWTFLDNFVNSGPFVIVERTINKEIIMEENELYWDKDNLVIQNLIFYTEKDPRRAMNLFIFNEVDWAPSVPIEMIDKVKDNPHFYVSPIYGTYYYEFNHSLSPMDNPKVRHALSLAINRDDLEKNYLSGLGVSTHTLIPQFGNTSRAESFTQDIELANTLLDESGYTSREKFPNLVITFNKHTDNERIAQFIQEQWNTHLNIKVEIKDQPWKEYLTIRDEGAFNIIRSGWISTYQDPQSLLAVFMTESIHNHGKYFNLEFNELISSSMTASDEERMSMLHQAEQLLLEDNALIPLYHFASYDLINLDKWEGWYPNMLQVHPYIAIRKSSKKKSNSASSDTQDTPPETQESEPQEVTADSTAQ